MTREEAIEFLKDHEYWADFSWMDEVAEIAIPDIEKQIQKKPMYERISYDGDFGGEEYDTPICPNCGWLFEENEIGCHHCRCGQSLDWSE